VRLNDEIGFGQGSVAMAIVLDRGLIWTLVTGHKGKMWIRTRDPEDSLISAGEMVARSAGSAGRREDYSILETLAGDKIARSTGGTSGREGFSILKLVVMDEMDGMGGMDGLRG
jgi:hypothetical protein